MYGDPSEVLADGDVFDLIGETPKTNDHDNSTDIFKSGRKEGNRKILLSSSCTHNPSMPDHCSTK